MPPNKGHAADRLRRLLMARPFGGGKNGALVALEAVSGKPVWSLDGEAPAYASPVLVEISGSRQIVTHAASGILAVDPESGELLLVGTGGEALRVARSYRVGQGSIWAHPAPLDDGILVKDRSRLTRWRF